MLGLTERKIQKMDILIGKGLSIRKIAARVKCHKDHVLKRKQEIKARTDVPSTSSQQLMEVFAEIEVAPSEFEVAENLSSPLVPLLETGFFYKGPRGVSGEILSETSPPASETETALAEVVGAAVEVDVADEDETSSNDGSYVTLVPQETGVFYQEPSLNEVSATNGYECN